MNVWESHAGGIYVDGRPVQIKGATWSGLETPEGKLSQPPPTTHRSQTDVLSELRENKFNALRLPVSLDFMLKASPQQLTDLRAFMQSAADRGLLVFVALTALEAGKPVDLWYNDKYHEDDTIKGWTRLLKELTPSPSASATTNLVGVDLLDRPGPSATWGTTKPKTDWNTFAAKLIEALSKDVPEYDGLFLVQGLYDEASESQVAPPPCMHA